MNVFASVNAFTRPATAEERQAFIAAGGYWAPVGPTAIAVGGVEGQRGHKINGMTMWVPESIDPSAEY